MIEILDGLMHPNSRNYTGIIHNALLLLRNLLEVSISKKFSYLVYFPIMVT